jgi:hypothetical protein
MNSTSKKLLDKFKFKQVEDRVYELGCCAQLQNIHSQQQRAFNLVWALTEEEKQMCDTSVAVIGGGISGITVASGLVAAGAKVTIYEKMNDVLHLQEGCFTRFIHPNIASWPDEGSGYPVTHLPFMNWTAGEPAIVNKELRAQWNKLKEVFDSQIALRTNTLVNNIIWDKNDKKVKVISSCSTTIFDFVILAVGYGIEILDKSSSPSYWRNDDLSQPCIGFTKKVLVSGTGDGGLIEVLRLRIKDFQHSEFFKIMYQSWVQEAAKRGKESNWNLDKIWENESSDKLKEKHKDFFDQNQIRPDTEVILHSSSNNIFETPSQDLHRIFVSLLVAINEVSLQNGNKLEKIKRDISGKKWGAVLTNGDIIENLDLIVQRHGTDKALRNIFPNIDTNVLSEEWKQKDQNDPVTYKKYYPADFLANEFMLCHGEQKYEIGFVSCEQKSESLKARIETKLQSLEGQFEINNEKFDLITRAGANCELLSCRKYHPKTFNGLILKTNRRAVLELLFDNDNTEIQYHLLRIHLADTFPKEDTEHLDWLINLDTGVFLLNLRRSPQKLPNRIEIHCAKYEDGIYKGMYLSHSLLRFPVLIDIMQNKWPLTRMHGMGWAVMNTLNVNRKAQRGNELLARS